jgi:FkbM family methyltransferase
MEHYIEKLLKYVNYPNGFFIECGANDGITQSYTYELEKMGWRGILIEPSMTAFDSCRRNRSYENEFYNCALVAYDSVTGIKGDFDGHPMSSVGGKRLNRDGQIIVPTRTLNSILEELEITDIDLFSLDVEGYEAEVLKGFDIMKYKPKFIIVEVNAPVEWEVNALLKDYKVIANLTGYNKRDNPQWDGTHNDFLYGI